MAAPRRAAGGQEGSAGPGQAIVWRNVVLMGLLHLGAVYALSLVPRAHILTLLWGECGHGHSGGGTGGGGPGRARLGLSPVPLSPLLAAFVPGPSPGRSRDAIAIAIASAAPGPRLL